MLALEQAAQQTPGVKQEDGKPMLEILKGISGAFRPGILTSLMGVSGGTVRNCHLQHALHLLTGSISEYYAAQHCMSPA